MIMVDVEVPSIGRQYNFSLEEHTVIKTLIIEMTEIISQKESCRLLGKVEDFVLCSQNLEEILSVESSLCDYGIKNGSRLILV